MVKLMEKTFEPAPGILPVEGDEMLILRQRLKDILTGLCGAPTDGTGEMAGIADFTLLPKHPKSLNQRRDRLVSNYDFIWRETKIIYEAENYGASARHTAKEIVFGGFFLKTEIETLTLTKVLWHEFLHLVIDMDRALHHGQIDKIIKEHLRYFGDPNPLGTVSD